MICKPCGEEVRFGWRGGHPGWWHRDDVDHEADPIAPAEVHEVPIIPQPEVGCHPINPEDFAPRSGIRQIINLIARQGWDLVRLTAARGPYVGAKGEVLSISDSWVLGAAGAVGLDGSRRAVVGSWRDTKFDFALLLEVKDGHRTSELGNSDQMKTWIKGN